MIAVSAAQAWTPQPAHSYAAAAISAAMKQAAGQQQPVVLYKGTGMRVFRLLVRFKVFQLLGVAALAIPINTMFSEVRANAHALPASPARIGYIAKTGDMPVAISRGKVLQGQSHAPLQQLRCEKTATNCFYYTSQDLTKPRCARTWLMGRVAS